MSLDYFRQLVTTTLDKRVAEERLHIAAPGIEPIDYEAYFKEVFAGQVF